MRDLIDRQKAIDTLRAMQTYKLTEGDDMLLIDKAEAQTELMMLPSEQPDLDEWCTDCKEYDQERHCCPRFRRVIREVAEEVRQIAQPTIEAEPVRHGRWIPICLTSYPPQYRQMCSCCGHRHPTSEKYNYCPVCGAKMDGGDEHE